MNIQYTILYVHTMICKASFYDLTDTMILRCVNAGHFMRESLYFLAGYETYFVEDASRPVANSSATEAVADMRNSGRFSMFKYLPR